MKQQDASREADAPAEPRHSAGRKIAEWVSLSISGLIILVLSGYLLFEAFQGNDPVITVDAEARLSEVAEAGKRFILPVRISNRSKQTLLDLKVELRYEPPGSSPETTDLLIDYLGEQSQQTVYFYFDQHPSGLKVEARAASYRLE
jgi:uncharacterized protein (TIGR02588 family)